MAKPGTSNTELEASDEVKEIYCEPCHKTGHLAIAQGFCVDCPEYLCEQCYDRHGKYKVFQSHQLLDKNSMSLVSYPENIKLDACVEKCSIHSSKVTELFCVTCDKLGCMICITLDHRLCPKVMHIPDIVSDLENSDEFKNFKKDLMHITERLSKQADSIASNVSTNSELLKLAEQELKRQRAEINKFFDELEKKMADQFKNILKKNEETLKNASERLETMKTDIDKIKNDTDSKTNGQKCELFIAMKRGKQKMKTYDDQFNKLAADRRIQLYTIVPSKQILAMMRNTTEICKIATASLESETDIQTCIDKEIPSAHSLTIVQRHYCVVADKANKRVKVIDTKNKCVTSEIAIEEALYIWGLTTVSTNQVVVSISLPSGKHQLLFCSVSDSGIIRITKHLYVDNFYLDLVHYKGNLYGPFNHQVHKLNMNGEVVEKIQRDEQGANLFGFLQGIAINSDSKTIYLTDIEKQSVTSMTLDGTVKSVYKDKDLKDPSGITVDMDSYVYVRSTGTRSIHQLSVDLEKVQVFLEHVSGNDITYSCTENKLYTSFGSVISQYSLDVNETKYSLVVN